MISATIASPNFQHLYDNPFLSDVILSFGDHRIKAHKAILIGYSKVFLAAFTSKLPTTTAGVYEIEGHDSDLVLDMIKHIYGFPEMTIAPPSPEEKARIYYLQDLFLLANEYEVATLSALVTGNFTEMLQSFPKECYIHAGRDGRSTRYLDTSSSRKLSMVIREVAELYHDNKIADKSLMHGVLDALLEMGPGFEWLELHLQITAVLQGMNEFLAELISRSKREFL
ncbi:hypothetical protein D6D01_06747 [Aureobasidium pullulans]|uniref:BTB domain-containing protein n=1 Tax=Aureobasidium pullulans TaxID=5580 RepID=A0A4S9KV93_AURPU|nr:hypothetical protein D6D01_06747 [Aureobasidium pullulans]